MNDKIHLLLKRSGLDEILDYYKKNEGKNYDTNLKKFVNLLLAEVAADLYEKANEYKKCGGYEISSRVTAQAAEIVMLSFTEKNYKFG